MDNTAEVLIIDGVRCTGKYQADNQWMEDPHCSCMYIIVSNSQSMIKEFEIPVFHPANYNIFEIINFRVYEALPRWFQADPDPIFMTNISRKMSDIAWHSRYRTVYPHSLEYMALRAITLDDIETLTKVLQSPQFRIDSRIDKKYNLNALQFAAMKNKFPVIELLLMYGADIDKQDTEGNTPLMMAVNNECLESINTLLKNGCDRDKPNVYGKKPSDKAVQQQSQYIADFINGYPQTKRRFPRFRVQLDIEKYLSSPVDSFLENYRVCWKKLLKSPFNNFKGEYRIVLNNFKAIGELVARKQ